MSNSAGVQRPRFVAALKANDFLSIGESIKALVVRLEPGTVRLAVEVHEMKHAAERGRHPESAQQTRIIFDPPLETR
jgi:hypothetical protein